MNKAFRQGFMVGVLAPVAFIAGFVYSIYRFTRRVPFPVRRADEGEVVVRLVTPDEVPGYWAHWKTELQPLLSRLNRLADMVRAEHEHLGG